MISPERSSAPALASGRVHALVFCALTLAGCYRQFDLVDPPVDDGGVLARRDGGSPRDAGPVDGGSTFVEPVGECAVPSGVDLLFVIDNSNSMTEEQASLTVQLPALIDLLVDPPDEDLDGAPDWLAVPSLHIGIVSTDMGTGGHSVPTCDRGTFGSRLGDDGILLTRGNTSIAGCMATYPEVFLFTAGIDEPGAFAADVACVATLGTGGCGFEQPLEAMLKALSPAAPTAYTSPSYVPPTFVERTLGHGDRENAAFLRTDSLLAVVIVTDEEDCSAREPGVFDPSSPTYGGVDLNLRCFTFPEVQHPIERYVDGLRALRANRPDLLALAVIAGIPVDVAVPSPTTADYEAILAHPDMQEMVDPLMPTRLRPSCNVAGRGIAFPPQRLVRTALGLGTARSTVQSICQSDFGPAIMPVVRLIGRRACQARVVD